MVTLGSKLSIKIINRSVGTRGGFLLSRGLKLSESKNHHYVPKHLQQAFRANPKDQVWCYDKSKCQHFLTNPKNILSETYFNEFDIEYEGNDFIVSAENWITKVEAIYQPALQKILSTEDLRLISPLETAALLILLPFQAFRTRTSRDTYEKMRIEIVKQIKEKTPYNVNPEEELEELRQLSESETKTLHLRMLRTLAPEMVDILVGRDIVLFRAPKDDVLILGDHPVVLHNDVDHGFGGNLGWKVKGIQIFLPISPNLLLAVLCPSVLDATLEKCETEASKLLELAFTMGKQNPNFFDQIRQEAAQSIESARAFVKVARSGQTSILSSENVLFCNSLQINFASRFVISSENNFSLAKKMTRDNKNDNPALSRSLHGNKLAKGPVVYRDGKFGI